jgi:rhodanese-related sulfurtransferase
MEQTMGFMKVVNEARVRVNELSVEEARARLAENPLAVLVDVREDSEWEKGRAAEATHLGKGILERDIERLFPNLDTELILYCGGGYRSVLAASIAQRMGYRNVYSLRGGYKALLRSDWPLASG